MIISYFCGECKIFALCALVSPNYPNFDQCLHQSNKMLSYMIAHFFTKNVCYAFSFSKTQHKIWVVLQLYCEQYLSNVAWEVMNPSNQISFSSSFCSPRDVTLPYQAALRLIQKTCQACIQIVQFKLNCGKYQFIILLLYYYLLFNINLCRQPIQSTWWQAGLPAR